MNIKLCAKEYLQSSRFVDSRDSRLLLGGRIGSGGGIWPAGEQDGTTSPSDGRCVGVVTPTGGREGKAGGVWDCLLGKVIEAIPRFTAALASIAVVTLLVPY